MLALTAPQAETLWDEVLPIEVKELPEDLTKLDELLSDPQLLRPIARHWEQEESETGRAVLTDGRPTIAMETYVRLMVIKQRSGWGYETLVREVSDSIHLRRFCLIPLHARVPNESTTLRPGAGQGCARRTPASQGADLGRRHKNEVHAAQAAGHRASGRSAAALQTAPGAARQRHQGRAAG